MKYKLILLDLDGTILTTNGTITLMVKKCIIECKKRGYYIGIITGRTNSKKTHELLKDLPYDCIAFCNGATIYFRNKLIESNTLSIKQGFSIIQKIKADFVNIKMDIVIEPWKYYIPENILYHMETGDMKTCNFNALPAANIQRIRIKNAPEQLMSVNKYMVSNSLFYRTISNDIIIVYKNATKKHAVQKACNLFGIPPSQIIAFGDDVTDIDMLRFSGIGIAMGNATKRLKKVANYITETNDNNGVPIWIYRNLFNNGKDM